MLAKPDGEVEEQKQIGLPELMCLKAPEEARLK
jgi:hypothetical protein